jgi:hypothetical protein
MIAPRAAATVELSFARDQQAAALRQGDAFAFFFNAEVEAKDEPAPPFTLFLEYEFGAAGGTEPRQGSVVFSDLPAEPAPQAADE